MEKTKTFYPKDSIEKLKKLPNGENIGKIKVDFVGSYLNPCCISGIDNLRGFIDLETPHESHSFWKNNINIGIAEPNEIHIGISGDLILKDIRTSNVKPHIDIYFPLSELDNLIEILRKIKAKEWERFTKR